MNKDDNTESTCRICLQNNNKELKWIFDTNYSTGRPLQFSEMLKTFAKVEVSLGDGLPELICSDCARDMIKTYLFKLKCEESDKTLRNCLDERAALMHFVKIEIQEEEVFEKIIQSEIEDNNREDNLSQTIVFDENNTDEYNQLFKSNRETFLERCAREDIARFNKIAEISQIEMIEENLDYATLRVNEKVTFPVCLVDSDQISNLHDELCNFQLRSILTEKLHECEICKKKFAKTSLLKNHNRRMHTGEKPCECDVCRKKYTQLRVLTTHKRIHTGEKPYECDVCGNKFAQSGSVGRHKRQVHKEQKLQL